MKNILIFIIVLFCSCTSKDKFNGYVYDYDSGKPLKNVRIIINGNKTQTDSTGYFCMSINSNSTCNMLFAKEGYASKKLYRKPDSLGKFSKKSLKYNRFYLYTKESDFTEK
jgi:hypothetical protein